MTLIKSVSGIRGTIGGSAGNNLTPLDVVLYTSAYAKWVVTQTATASSTIIIGRDARISGSIVRDLVANTLISMGFNVIDLGLATTPTVELAVSYEKAAGGIILTASHNPREWNALKLLNHKGEFISALDGERILQYAEEANFKYATIDNLGAIQTKDIYNQLHINAIVELPLVNVEAIRKAQFTVAIDCVNSVGGTIIPQLLTALGVKKTIELYCTPNGEFPHNPEPLPEHLEEISKTVVNSKADIGFVVDPDVDRLAIIQENGQMFGEEYTLVAIADYVLSKTPGNTVSNLSSTRALKDVSTRYGVNYKASSVGEVHVVAAMKETQAVIGGEGNGGIIYPELHYGRDALVGIALFLTHLAESTKTCSELRAQYPHYEMSKNKVELTSSTDIDALLSNIIKLYATEKITTSDGVKIDFEHAWVHLRKSNTEPIIRIYAEAPTKKEADELAEKIITEIKNIQTS